MKKIPFIKYLKGNAKINISILVIIAVITICAVLASDSIIKNTTNQRVTDELEFLAGQQAELVHIEIEDQIVPLRTVASLIENGLDFSDSDDQKILNVFVQSNIWCMLGYADMNGDVISYLGESLGNVSDRDYFYGITKENRDYV